VLCREGTATRDRGVRDAWAEVSKICSTLSLDTVRSIARPT
jgi:hypothetical protein